MWPVIVLCLTVCIMTFETIEIALRSRCLCYCSVFYFLLTSDPMAPILGPKQSARFVSSNAQHVSIDETGVEKVAIEVHVFII